MGIIKDCPRNSIEKCTDKYGCQGACKAVEQFEKEWREESSQKREWVGLTDEEAKKTFEKHNCTISADLAGILARAIIAKLKEKNGG